MANLCFLTNCTIKQANLKIDSEIINFGSVSADTLLVVEYKLINNGLGDLHIKNIDADCSCTIIKDYPEILKSNDTISLKVNYRTKLSGYFEQLIFIESNSVENLKILTIKGQVIPY